MTEPAGCMVRVEAPGGDPYDAYITGEAGVSRPALLIFSPIFGIDDDMKRIADEWAADGYVVGVPDYFFRVKPGVIDRSENGRKEAFARWDKLDVDRAIVDMRSLVSRLLQAKACNGRLGALGFCAGGELAFLAAVRLGARAIAAFHGTRMHRHLAEAGSIEALVSLHFGDSDSLVPLPEVAQIRQAFRDNPRVEICVYAGAQHGFSFRGRPSYHESAATQSRKKASQTLSNLKRVVGEENQVEVSSRAPD